MFLCSKTNHMQHYNMLKMGRLQLYINIYACNSYVLLLQPNGMFKFGTCAKVHGFVGPQNAPLHNMLLLVAYCVPCIHNMLHWSILCTLHTQYATSGAYCVGSIHMLFQWSSEGTQYALLENMSRGICLSF